MPCASSDELLEIGEHLLLCAKTDAMKKLLEKEEIMNRIRIFGPFNRYVFPSNEEKNEENMANRINAINSLNVDQISKLMKAEGSDTADYKEISHWFLRYDVNRGSEKPYFVDSINMVISSDDTLRRVKDEFFTLSLQELIAEFQKVRNSVKRTIDPLLLEQLFVRHLDGTKGVNWKFRDLSTPVLRKEAIWQQKELHFNRVERGSIPDVNTMSEDVLYCDMQVNFPFVDAVWKIKSEIFSAQMTVSDSHPESISAMQTMRELLNMQENQKLHVWYVLLPDKGIGSIPLSFFWKNCSTTEVKEQIGEAENFLSFGILQLPPDFGAGPKTFLQKSSQLVGS